MRKKTLRLIKLPYSKFKSYSIKKKILSLIILIVIIAVVATQIQSRFKDNGYITETVSRSNISEIVTEAGNIETVGKTDVFSPSTGIVEEIYTQNGDYVTRDQKLFKVNSTATVQEQQAAYSNYLIAKSTLETAQSTLHSLRSGMYTEWKSFRDIATSSEYETDSGAPKKDERLTAEFQSSQDDWLASEARYKDQQTAIAQGQASVNSAWLLYQATQDATVLALSDGVISNLAIGENDNVKSSLGATGLTLTTPTPILSIINASNYVAKISLSEADVYKVIPGQEVDIEVDAYRNEKYKGVVLRVDDIGTDINSVIKFNAYIEITNSDEKLKYGMTIDADIKTKTVNNALTVANSAIKPHKGGRAVRVYDKKTKKIEFIPVEIGIKGQDKTEIASGISEGQEIISSLKNEQIKIKGAFGF